MKSMKIVINKCFGGFTLSPASIEYYLKLKGKECYFYKQFVYKHDKGFDEYRYIKNPDVNDDFLTSMTKYLGETTRDLWSKENQAYYFYYNNIERTDIDLIKTVEDLGDKASGSYSKLEIVDIPDDIQYDIDDYDGIETIHEHHRSW